MLLTVCGAEQTHPSHSGSSHPFQLGLQEQGMMLCLSELEEELKADYNPGLILQVVSFGAPLSPSGHSETRQSCCVCVQRGTCSSSPVFFIDKRKTECGFHTGLKEMCFSVCIKARFQEEIQFRNKMWEDFFYYYYLVLAIGMALMVF